MQLVLITNLVTNNLYTVHLETTHGLDFKTPNFPHHVIYSRYSLEEENPYIPKKIHVIFWESSAVFVEDSHFK